MTKDEALRLALEALEEITRRNQSDHQAEIADEAITAIKAALEAKDEPVAWMYSPTGALFDICPNDADEGEFLPLYTTPPQRKPLTDEEIIDHFQTNVDTGFLLSFVDGVRYAEAAHGIKELA
jgi:hypothetical protein